MLQDFFVCQSNSGKLVTDENIEKFNKETVLKDKLKEDSAYLCWVMALYLDRNDVSSRILF